MGSTAIFATLAFLFSAAVYVPYMRWAMSSHARLTISTWISWGIMDAVILAAIIAAGEIAWQLVAYIVGVVLVIGASVWKGALVGWTRLDSTCIAIVIFAIGLWSIFGNPNLAIVLNLIAITIGTIPMFVNVWRTPENEPLLPWFLCTTGGIFGVLAIPAWNVAAALTPVWYLVLQVFMTLLISRKLRTKDAAA